MRTMLAESDVVVIAHDVNLSIFRPAWFTKYEVFTEAELEGELVISPVVVQVPTAGFKLTVLPNRLQMAFQGPSPGSSDDVDRILGRIVRILPHTPYSACGLNFTYVATCDDDGFRNWDERLFSSEAARRAGAIGLTDARFGTYFSFDALGGRLKLDIKPTKTPEQASALAAGWPEGADVVRANFNYHFELEGAEDPDKAVLESLAAWQVAAAQSRDLLDAILGEAK